MILTLFFKAIYLTFCVRVIGNYHYSRNLCGIVSTLRLHLVVVFYIFSHVTPKFSVTHFSNLIGFYNTRTQDWPTN